MKCKDCKDFDREVGCCGKMPSEIEEEICLLRHLCYSINSLWQVMEDGNSDGDDWKV